MKRSNSNPNAGSPPLKKSKPNVVVFSTPAPVGKALPHTPVLLETTTEETGLSRSVTLMIDQREALKSAPVEVQASGGLRRSLTAPAQSVFVPPSLPSRIVIVRHGQSEQNAALDLLQPDIDTLSAVRDADIRLTSLGRFQAEKTGEFLANSQPFDICFTSPYRRAKKTAQYICSQLPYDLKQFSDNRLREKEFGKLHGLNASAVRERYPEEIAIRARDGKYWYRFPQGENYPDVEMRVHSFMGMLREYAGRSVLVVTHQVPYKMFTAVIRHLDEDGVGELEAVKNCGMQEYVYDMSKGRLRLSHFNNIAYDNSAFQDE